MMRVKNRAFVWVSVIVPAASIESSVYGAFVMSNGLMFILFFVYYGLNH
jgi:hypothetical protein